MSMFVRTTILSALAAAGLGLAASAGAESVQPAGQQGCVSPPGMNYMICNGQRVPKPTRSYVKPDGTKVEEQESRGGCREIRERRPDGSTLLKTDCGAKPS